MNLVPPDISGITNLILVHGIPEGAQRKQVQTALAPDCLISQYVLREHLENPKYPPEWAGYCYAMADLKLFSDYPGHLDVTFDGWDADHREIFQIPEIQRFCEGFLGRKTFIYDLQSEHDPGLWEGLILRLLHEQDPLHPDQPRSGTRLRLFGAADQRRSRPRVNWTWHSPTHSWVCAPTEAFAVMKDLMAGSPPVEDKVGCWGAGMRLPSPSDYPSDRRPQ